MVRMGFVDDGFDEGFDEGCDEESHVAIQGEHVEEGYEVLRRLCCGWPAIREEREGVMAVSRRETVLRMVIGSETAALAAPAAPLTVLVARVVLSIHDSPGAASRSRLPIVR